MLFLLSITILNMLNRVKSHLIRRKKMISNICCFKAAILNHGKSFMNKPERMTWIRSPKAVQRYNYPFVLATMPVPSSCYSLGKIKSVQWVDVLHEKLLISHKSVHWRIWYICVVLLLNSIQINRSKSYINISNIYLFILIKDFCHKICKLQ